MRISIQPRRLGVLMAKAAPARSDHPPARAAGPPGSVEQAPPASRAPGSPSMAAASRRLRAVRRHRRGAEAGRGHLGDRQDPRPGRTGPRTSTRMTTATTRPWCGSPRRPASRSSTRSTSTTTTPTTARSRTSSRSARSPAPTRSASPSGWWPGLIRFGYVQDLDAANIPNKANLAPALLNPDFDPGRKKSLPWQNGFAGLAWDSEAYPGRARDAR